jgi:hypothetical protein
VGAEDRPADALDISRTVTARPRAEDTPTTLVLAQGARSEAGRSSLPEKCKGPDVATRCPGENNASDAHSLAGVIMMVRVAALRIGLFSDCEGDAAALEAVRRADVHRFDEGVIPLPGVDDWIGAGSRPCTSRSSRIAATLRPRLDRVAHVRGPFHSECG